MSLSVLRFVPENKFGCKSNIYRFFPQKRRTANPKQSNVSQNNLAGLKIANRGIFISLQILNNYSLVTVLQNYKE